MAIDFGREICGNLDSAETREWLVTNGIGGYASGTVAGLLRRRYHGLLVAALKPSLERTLMLAKLDEAALYDERFYPLHTNRWADEVIDPLGCKHIERFWLEGTIPVWKFACADALLEKRVWMQQGSNTTYVCFHLQRATKPLTLTLKALVNYRDYHGSTQASDWQMSIKSIEHGFCITALPKAVPLYLLTDSAKASPAHIWYYGFDLAGERYRGLEAQEAHLHAATFRATLEPGASLTFVASTEMHPGLDGEVALQSQLTHEQTLMERWKAQHTDADQPAWVNQLVLSADQFIVSRPQFTEARPAGVPVAGSNPHQDSRLTPETDSMNVYPDQRETTIIAGYHWFGDWGRDTMISLPGLSLSTGRPEVARDLLRTFARYVDQGMLPNRFPSGESPEYNTVDAALWYFEAIRAYHTATGDNDLLRELFPVLAKIIHWHCRGTCFEIHLDPSDGLLYAGTSGVQLTWMDAKVGDWVVTPRTGKPIEVNALWYNALRTMAAFSQQIGKPNQEYEQMQQRTAAGFSRFWNDATGYCYDVLDGPQGHDASLRPNQIFAVSLPETPLTVVQQQGVVEACARNLVTSYGLRSLAPDHPQYQGHYGGDPRQRDSAYHQGTVWGWLIGPFALAHLRVFQAPAQARSFLEPMANHLQAHGVGSLSEIFDGNVPLVPRGCIAQAWTVAEVLRAWVAIQSGKSH